MCYTRPAFSILESGFGLSSEQVHDVGIGAKPAGFAIRAIADQ
jgi:hypothetical protein